MSNEFHLHICSGRSTPISHTAAHFPMVNMTLIWRAIFGAGHTVHSVCHVFTRHSVIDKLPTHTHKRGPSESHSLSMHSTASIKRILINFLLSMSEKIGWCEATCDWWEIECENAHVLMLCGDGAFFTKPCGRLFRMTRSPAMWQHSIPDDCSVRRNTRIAHKHIRFILFLTNANAFDIHFTWIITVNLSFLRSISLIMWALGQQHKRLHSQCNKYAC